MRALLLILAVFLVPTFAQASTHAENLKKCRMIARLPDSRLAPIARSVHATVRQIRQACWILQHPSHYRGGSSGGSSEPAPTDSCGGTCSYGELCQFIPGGWQCVFHSSPQNVCHTAGDCGTGICYEGTCH